MLQLTSKELAMVTVIACKYVLADIAYVRTSK